MTTQVFVLTEEYSHRLVGVYSSYSLAMNALFNNALGYSVMDVDPQPVGTAYNFKDVNNGNDISFFVEVVDMDDSLWLGPTEMYKEEEEE